MSQLLRATVADPDESSGVHSRERFFLIAALFPIAIGAALRVYHLGVRSLWFDEALTANTSRGTLAHMVQATRLRGSAPVVYPYILYLVQKVGQGAIVARAPSVLASLLAILMMLAMVRAKISRNAALFSAAILAVSASQIRYAQEVREYSLAVLLATILIFCFLRWEAAGSRGHQPVPLYVALFFAPLIQYGLVFLAFGILCTIGLRLWLTRDTSFRRSHLVIASASLAAGAIVSFVLTLRYQFHPGRGEWYLAANYFNPKRASLLSFVSSNTSGLVTFLIPEHVVRIAFVLCAIIFCVIQARTRKYHSITLLVLTSVSITLCASIAGVYPYGGIRQCLFLAPVVVLFAGVACADTLQRIKVLPRPAVAIAFTALILVSGYRSVLNQWPYKEVEDTLSILRVLNRSMGPNDQVWVNHDAAEAFEFYQPKRDTRFTYGAFHTDAQEYIPELRGSIHPHTKRLWLVFSHLSQPSDHAEEQLIVNSLRPGWAVHPVITPINTALYVADRKTSPLSAHPGLAP